MTMIDNNVPLHLRSIAVDDSESSDTLKEQL